MNSEEKPRISENTNTKLAMNQLETLEVEPKDTQAESLSVRDSDSGHERSPSSTSENDSDLQLECFTDAADEFCETSEERKDSLNSSTTNESDLKESLEQTTIILRLALNNQFNLALDMCSRSGERDLYANLARATLSFLRAALTLEREDLQSAISSINRSFELSGNLKRKKSVASQMIRFLYRPDYDQYTDEEIHAELVYAESLLMLALVSFLADQSILCLIKGALRIRTCYQRYKECLHIMEQRTNWSCWQTKEHFESGVRMGHGIFNLLMSYLPRRVLNFLQYVGFSGDRNLGIDELEKSIDLKDGLRSVFSTLVILTYHSYVENIFGLGSYDEAKVKVLNDSLAEHYPNSAFYLLFLGRYNQILGKLPEAIDTYERCIKCQDDWHQFHAICHWEMMWSYAVQMDWTMAARYSNLLRQKSKWSPASYTYQYATFLYAQLVEENIAGTCEKGSSQYKIRMDEIQKIMESVPSLSIRYGGKRLPAEKFAITRAQRFLKQSNRLTLPALEFLYIWNVFSTLNNAPKQVEGLLAKIDNEIEFIKADQTTASKDTQVTGSDYLAGDLALANLLRGMCLKNLNRNEEAELSFMDIIEAEDSIQEDSFLVPHTAMELATMNLSLKRYPQAEEWIRLARNNYTGYLLETIVHFRLHAATRAIQKAQESA